MVAPWHSDINKKTRFFISPRHIPFGGQAAPLLLFGIRQFHRSESGGVGAWLGHAKFSPQTMLGQIGDEIESLPIFASAYWQPSYTELAEMAGDSGLRKTVLNKKPNILYFLQHKNSVCGISTLLL